MGILYDGNDEKVELIEEVAEVVKVTYEIRNLDLISDEYYYDIYEPYSEILVRGRKEQVDNVHSAKVVIDFYEIERIKRGEYNLAGNHMLDDLPIIVYDKDERKIDDIIIIPSSKLNISITLTKKGQH